MYYPSRIMDLSSMDETKLFIWNSLKQDSFYIQSSNTFATLAYLDLILLQVGTRVIGSTSINPTSLILFRKKIKITVIMINI